MNPLLPYFAVTLELPAQLRGPISVSTCFHRFKRWRGSPLPDTYGGKVVLDWEGEPVFAELAIVRLVQASGWQAVWVDTYRRKFRQHLPPSSCELPVSARNVLERANAGKKWCPGCPDVFAWNESGYLFVEAKRKGKDSIRDTQIRWLGSALLTIPEESFLVFEWAIAD